MKTIYTDILKAKSKNQKLLAILLDPDKIKWDSIDILCQKISSSNATHIFIGGSIVPENLTQKLVEKLSAKIKIPMILFPGDYTQISHKADAILFLSLISGRNSEYLIGQHVRSVPFLNHTNLEVIPTSYILIESGNQTAVARVSKTLPMKRTDIELIVNTAKAGEFLGHKLCYLEAGSGAQTPLSEEIIQNVSQNLTIPVIVGGGIRSKTQMDIIYKAGADLIVIGTAFEKDYNFFES